MWTYRQHDGQIALTRGSLTIIYGHGYSGCGDGLNNPALEADAGVGPIPKGRYPIGAPLDPVDHLGPLALSLTPDPANVMFRRSAFFIHGDNAEGNHTASHGCIILDHAIRVQIDASTDKELTVTT